MGFYIRKSINLGGGLRLNLSRGGLGLSGGVKGFRVGMNGRGTYVHMGRGGLYYRKQFSYRKPRANGRPPSQLQPSSRPQESEGVGAIFTENLAQPLDVKSGTAALNDVLDHFKPKNAGWGVAAWILGFVTLVALFNSQIWALIFGAMTGTAIAAHYVLRPNKTLVYDLEEAPLEAFHRFVEAFEEFFRTQKLWLYETRTHTADWKRNAGASALIKRQVAATSLEGERQIKSNISIPSLISGMNRLYFLPDMMVCVYGANVTGFAYGDVGVEAFISQFIENEGVPRDADVVGHTWTYVNKDGGPDRRFNNNRQIPVCAYQQIEITAGATYARTLAKSRVSDIYPLTNALDELRAVRATVVEVIDKPLLAIPDQSTPDAFPPPCEGNAANSHGGPQSLKPDNSTSGKIETKSEKMTDVNSTSAPFGIVLHQPISSLPASQPLEGDKYKVTPPGPHPLFEDYFVRATPNLGVVWIKANSAPIDNDKFGTELRGLADRVASQVAQRYGAGKKTDFLFSGALWNEPQYWLNAIEARERSYFYMWERKSGAQLPADLDSIFIGVVSYDGVSGAVTLEYSSPKLASADAEQEQSMSSLL